MRVRRGKRPCGSRREETRQAASQARNAYTITVTYFVTAIGAPFQKDDDIFGQIWSQRHKDTEKKHGALDAASSASVSQCLGGLSKSMRRRNYENQATHHLDTETVWLVVDLAG